MMGTGMIGGMLFVLLCAALGIALVAGIVWLVVRAAPAVGRGHPNRSLMGSEEDDPVQVLRRRYAAGEIDEDEYLRRLSGLSQQ